MTSSAGRQRHGVGGLLKGCGITVGIVGLIALGALLFSYVQIQQSFKAPEAVPLAVRWETWAIVLRPGEPVAEGRLRLVVPGPVDGQTRSVVSIGLPDIDRKDPGAASIAPADLLGVPVVRLSVAVGGAPPFTCLAPCEQAVGSGASDWTIVVEAVDGALDVPIHVTVGAGVTARPGTPLPAGVEVSIGPADATTGGG
jgi:hypothetical protein